MTARRSRRLAGLEPVFTPSDKVVYISPSDKVVYISPSDKVVTPLRNNFFTISQYLFFLVWSTFLLRSVLLR
jgi:hypothetical protein